MIKRLYDKIILTLALVPQKPKLAFFIVMLTLSLLFQVYHYYTDTQAGPSNHCIALKETVEKAIHEASTCSTDLDCVTTSFACPFLCNVTIARDANPAPIIAAISAYNSSCGFCVDACPPQAVPICKEHRCIVPRKQS